MPGYLEKGKVYLNPPSPSHAPMRMSINWSAVTGIDIITEGGKPEAHSEVWYTLDGRKLDGKPTQKGMYIKNGQKAIIR